MDRNLSTGPTFPHAAVHMLREERDSAMVRKSALDRMRYRPQQWSTRANWRVYRPGDGERWFGFDCVRPLEGVSSEILLVSLIGHTLGHAGVAVKRDEGWLLQAGDAYFYHAEMDLDRPWCTPGLRFYQWMMEKDRLARLQNQRRLRELRRAQGAEVTIFCAHDAVEFERLAGRLPQEVPSSVSRPSVAAAVDRVPS